LGRDVQKIKEMKRDVQKIKEMFKKKTRSKNKRDVHKKKHVQKTILHYFNVLS